MTHVGAAQSAADVWLQDLWVARETAQLRLRPGLLKLEPGDLVSLPVATGNPLYRIVRISDDEAREVEARAIDLTTATHVPMKGIRLSVSPPRLPGPPRIEIVDLAWARADPPTLQYVAAFADPWPGALSIYRSIEGASFEFFQQITRPAILGTLVEDLPAGPVDRFDRANSIYVSLSGGALSSASELETLSGRNRLAIRGPDDQWEVLAFVRAELIGSGLWRLSQLLRGLGGQTHLAQRLAPAGSTAVLLDDAIVPLATGAQELGMARILRIGPSTRDHGDASFVERHIVAGDLALKPLAPVGARARRVSTGIKVGFIRRGRISADLWEAVEIPLGEETEAYVVDILDGDVVKRSLTVTSPDFIYLSEQEQADFGRRLDVLSLRIAQVSAIVGRGFPLEAQITLL